GRGGLLERRGGGGRHPPIIDSVAAVGSISSDRTQSVRWNAVTGLAIVLFLCGCQSGPQLPPTPVIGATCQTLSGSCLLLTPPPSGGGCTCPGLGDGIVTGASGP